MASTIWLNSEGNILINDSREILLCNECPCEDIIPDIERIILDHFHCCATDVSVSLPITLYAHFSPNFCGISSVTLGFISLAPVGGAAPPEAYAATWGGSVTDALSRSLTMSFSLFNEWTPAPLTCAGAFDIQGLPPTDPHLFYPMYPFISSGPDWNCYLVSEVPLPFQGTFSMWDCITFIPTNTLISIDGTP